MKQMKSVEKLTQGLSTHAKSQKNVEIDFTDEMSEKSLQEHGRSFNMEFHQPEVAYKSQTSKNSEASNSFQKKAQQ